MTTGTATAHIHHDRTAVRFTNDVESYYSDEQRARLDALAHAYGTSRSGLQRHFLDAVYFETFGLIDPAYVENDILPADTYNQLLGGDLEWTDVDESFYVDGTTYFESRPENDEVLAPTTPDPEFHRTVGTQDLARPGIELTWEDLKTIVEQHDDEDPTTAALEIHPDRVPRGTLKRRTTTTGPVLAAMARVRADDDAVSRGTLIDLVLDQLTPTADRHDEAEAHNYLINEWVPVVGDYLYEAPDAGQFFTTLTALNTHINDTIEYGLEEARIDETTLAMLDVDEWLDAADHDGNRKQGEAIWTQRVASWLEDVVRLYQTAATYPDLVRYQDIEVPDWNTDAYDLCIKTSLEAYRVGRKKLGHRMDTVVDETDPGLEDARRDLAENALGE